MIFKGSFSKVRFQKSVEINNWERGEQYAKDITDDLNHFTNSYIDWNLALGKYLKIIFIKKNELNFL